MLTFAKTPYYIFFIFCLHVIIDEKLLLYYIFIRKYFGGIFNKFSLTISLDVFLSLKVNNHRSNFKTLRLILSRHVIRCVLK